MTLQQRLVALRHALSETQRPLSQADLARRLSIHVRTLHNYESGKTVPTGAAKVWIELKLNELEAGHADNQ